MRSGLRVRVSVRARVRVRVRVGVRVRVRVRVRVEVKVRVRDRVKVSPSPPRRCHPISPYISLYLPPHRVAAPQLGAKPRTERLHLP